jgi:hypothetical protein
MRANFGHWSKRCCAVGLTLAIGISVLTEAPARAASISGTGMAQIVAHALDYAPRDIPALSSGSSDDIQIVGATATLASKSGNASLTAADPVDSVIQAEPGGVRELTVLHHGDTARFVFSLPTGATLHQTNAGGFLVLSRTSRVVGLITAPWAVDARGKLLATHYAAEGDVIVQTVDTRGAVYPIVADPSFHWYWDGVVITLSWAEQMAVADGGLSVLIPFLLASGYGWPVVAAVGWVSTYAGYYAAHNQCFWFWVPYLAPWTTSYGTYSC